MRLNPSQANPGRGPGSSMKIDENCRLSHPYHCMIQAVALRLHMIQAFSTCIKPLSCDPALKCSSLQCHHASQHILFTQVWGIGLAGLQVLTSELRIPNQKKLVPITYQCHLRLCLWTFWTFATFCYPGTDFGISRNLPPPLRFHTHNRDNTGLNSERGPNNQEFRNVETLGPQTHTHTLADSGVLSDYRGKDAITTCTQDRKPQDNTHTHNRDCECSVPRPEKSLR